VGLEGSHKKALSKGCLWMGESDGGSEGGRDEASQQPGPHQQHSTAKTHDEEELSKFYHL